MAGGLITVQPPADISSDFDPAKNSIVGNTCLYGASSSTDALANASPSVTLVPPPSSKASVTTAVNT